MRGSYGFHADVRHKLLIIELRGFLDRSQFDAFERDGRAALRSLSCRRNEHLTLMDLRSATIMSQQAVETFAQSLSDPITAARKIAFVTPSALARLQIKRIAGDRVAAYFDTVPDAMRWLLSQQPKPSA